jgi:hypothetical protein
MSKREKGRTWWETENERVKEKYKNTTKEGKFENEEERVRGIQWVKMELYDDIHSMHICIN